MQVRIATSQDHPSLDDDGPRLIEALREAGLVVSIGAWDDPRVDWQEPDLVLIRSTWDYTLRRQAFLAWVRSCRNISNPAEVVAWNTDKAYLGELASAGIPTVDTLYLAPGAETPTRLDWPQVVIKPSVSASSADTGRFRAGDPTAQQLIERIHASGRTVMIQPYLRSVETRGETAVVYLGGAYSHAVRKGAILATIGSRGKLAGAEPSIERVEPSSKELQLADRVLGAVPFPLDGLSYARIDMLSDDRGEPVLLEAELTEPSLFLAHAGDAAMAGFAAHVRALASR